MSSIAKLVVAADVAAGTADCATFPHQGADATERAGAAGNLRTQDIQDAVPCARKDCGLGQVDAEGQVVDVLAQVDGYGGRVRFHLHDGPHRYSIGVGCKFGVVAELLLDPAPG
jgi:hypothetical protein